MIQLESRFTRQTCLMPVKIKVFNQNRPRNYILEGLNNVVNDKMGEIGPFCPICSLEPFHISLFSIKTFQTKQTARGNQCGF